MIGPCQPYALGFESKRIWVRPNAYALARRGMRPLAEDACLPLSWTPTVILLPSLLLHLGIPHHQSRPAMQHTLRF